MMRGGYYGVDGVYNIFNQLKSDEKEYHLDRLNAHNMNESIATI